MAKKCLAFKTEEAKNLGPTKITFYLVNGHFDLICRSIFVFLYCQMLTEDDHIFITDYKRPTTVCFNSSGDLNSENLTSGNI